MNYDVRTEVDGVRPPDFVLGPQQMPNPAAKILFKKRVN